MGLPPATGEARGLLCTASRGGDTAGIASLLETFAFTPDDARVLDNYPLRWAAYYGHRDILVCLHDEYGLTTEDARAHANFAIRCASTNGHLGVVRCLFRTYGLTKEDARTDEALALQWATANDHLEVVQCLCEEYRMDNMDIHGVLHFAPKDGLVDEYLHAMLAM